MSPASYAAAFETLGFDCPEILPKGGIRFVLPSMDVYLLAENEQIRIEFELVKGVSRNKIALWNAIHHNQHGFPFGQFYLSAKGQVCFGCLLNEAGLAWAPQRLLHEMLIAAQSYCRLIVSDFEHLPFDEKDFVPNVLSLLRSARDAPEPLTYVEREMAPSLLEHTLPDTLPDVLMYRMGKFEFQFLGDSITSLHLMPMSQLRRHAELANWAMKIRTEVGVLETTDECLWILVNRLNAHSCLLAYSLRYQDKKPILSLNTELPADALQQPWHLARVIAMHQRSSAQLLERLAEPYRIQHILKYNLGY